VPFLVSLVAALILLLLRFTKLVWELTQFFWVGSNRYLGWLIGMQLAFVATAVPLPLADRIAPVSHDRKSGELHPGSRRACCARRTELNRASLAYAGNTAPETPSKAPGKSSSHNSLSGSTGLGSSRRPLGTLVKTERR